MGCCGRSYVSSVAGSKAHSCRTEGHAEELAGSAHEMRGEEALPWLARFYCEVRLIEEQRDRSLSSRARRLQS